MWFCCGMRGRSCDRFQLKESGTKDEGVKQEMASFYQSLLRRLYGTQVSQEAVAQAVEDCRTAFGWMTDRTTLKKKILLRVEKGKLPTFPAMFGA